MKVRDLIPLLQTQDPDSFASVRIDLPGKFGSFVLEVSAVSTQVDYGTGRRHLIIGEPVEAADIIPCLEKTMQMVKAGAIGGEP